MCMCVLVSVCVCVFWECCLCLFAHRNCVLDVTVNLQSVLDFIGGNFLRKQTRLKEKEMAKDIQLQEEISSNSQQLLQSQEDRKHLQSKITSLQGVFLQF